MTKNWLILSNISGSAIRFLQSLQSFMRALWVADDKSEPYFPIWQGTLPWQPNNAAIMKAN